jgi:endonuclease V-like protein UPF0215 family
MLPKSDLSPIDGEHLNETLGLPVIKYEIVRARIGRVESWGIEKDVAVAILDAFRSEKLEPQAVSLANLLKKALENEG